MKGLSWICVVLCAALLLTGCQWDGISTEELLEDFDGFLQQLSQSQLTKDTALIGVQTYGEDAYAGGYFADCVRQTGRDVIFGGASIQERFLHCYGSITTESGEATVRIRLNGKVIFPETGADGKFDTELHLEPGENYIMVDYDHFSGNVEMTCEYAEG